MDFTAHALVNAITLGALYAMIAVGYTMVYGVVKLINFAHGEIYMLGAFWALLVVGMESVTGISLFVAIVPAVILCAGVGLSVDWTAYVSLRKRRALTDWLSIALLILLAVGAIIYKVAGEARTETGDTIRVVVQWGLLVLVPVAMLVFAAGDKFNLFGRGGRSIKVQRLNALITAIGMSLILQTLVLLIWGAQYHAFPAASIPEGFSKRVFNLLGAPVLQKELVIWIVAVVMMIVLQLLVSRTKIGTAMRACSMDKECAALMGISVDKVIAFTFVVGSGMAGVAGVLYAVKVGGNINPRMGYYPGLLAFAAAVLGGIGNIRGAMLGGVLIGAVQAFTGGQFTMPFLAMVIVLLVMPWGILGSPETKRA